MTNLGLDSRVGDAPPVIIAAATGDLSVVEAAAANLADRGHTVEIVSGVDDDPLQIVPAIAKMEGSGLYVLCRSQSLDRVQIERLREILRSRGVPFGRTLTLAVEAGSARALEERILSVSRRMITGKRESSHRGSAGLPKPPPSSMGSAVPSAPIPAAPSEDIDTLVGANASGVDSGEINAWAEAIARNQAGANNRVRGIPQPHDEFPSDGLIGMATGPGRPSPTSTAGGTMPEFANDLATSSSHAVRSGVGQPSAIPGGEQGPRLDDDVDPAVFTISGRIRQALGQQAWLYVGAAALGFVLLVTVVVVASGGDEPKDVKPASVVAVEDTPSRDPSEPAVPSEAEPAEEDPDVPTVVDDDDVQAAKAPVVPVAAVPPAKSVAGRSPVEDTPDVVAALLSREVRAWNIFLVAAELSGAVEYADAVRYCEQLEIEGLAGWRLPNVGELNSLANSRLVRTGTYWSTSEGDAFGDSRFVLRTRKRTVRITAAATTGNKDAKAVCIRERS